MNSRGGESVKMKLEYWMEDEDLDGYEDYKGYGYYVIRTCGECKHSSGGIDGVEQALCNNPVVPVAYIPVHFGCIHFEGKNGGIGKD